MKKCVFLDRDGVLIEDVGYLKNPDNMVLLPNTITALKNLKKIGFLLIIVTNQAGIAKGFFTVNDVEKIHKRLIGIYKDNGIAIDDLYYCPHHKDGVVKPYDIGCSCRKPNIGMVTGGVEKFDIDISKSFMVGDKDSDILLAKNSGLKSFYLRNTMYEHDKNIVPDFCVSDLKEASEIIMKL